MLWKHKGWHDNLGTIKMQYTRKITMRLWVWATSLHWTLHDHIHFNYLSLVLYFNIVITLWLSNTVITDWSWLTIFITLFFGRFQLAKGLRTCVEDIYPPLFECRVPFKLPAITTDVRKKVLQILLSAWAHGVKEVSICKDMIIQFDT